MVDMNGVLVAILANDAAGQHAVTSLSALGFSDQDLRFYPSSEMLLYEEEFRSDRTLTGRLVGAFVDDSDTMAQYVEFGEGRPLGAVGARAAARRCEPRRARTGGRADPLHLVPRRGSGGDHPDGVTLPPHRSTPWISI